ncbi:hypothetical protein [Aestuariivivens sediminicola]|uniref:hypothetical protein n=1 Tax=Aestuariivivens sediminicola TaxID=2913560 RepID=UPI001F5A15C6|nr:hypothetical protein [Aestuariivivens sediminicola]
MKGLIYVFILLSSSVFSQDRIEPVFLKKTDLNVEKLVGIDNFEAIYYIQNNVFHKSSPTKPLTYNNFKLGELSSANIFNPLKINLYYRDLNVVVILDNRLAEVFLINFNDLDIYRNVTQVSTGYDNTLWLFNQDTQELELYDYKTRSSRVKTLPVQDEVLDLKSNYNTCWLLTRTHLYVYNYFGSLLHKFEHPGFNNISEYNGNLVLEKENHLYFMKKNSGLFLPLEIKNLLITHFFVTNETLYIYDSKFLYEYQLKTN